MMVINYDNLELVQESLYNFQLLVRKYLEEHDLTSPKTRDPSKAIMEM
jgi:hypothetical protein